LLPMEGVMRLPDHVERAVELTGLGDDLG
jgi:hypothetical protein